MHPRDFLKVRLFQLSSLNYMRILFFQPLDSESLKMSYLPAIINLYLHLNVSRDKWLSFMNPLVRLFEMLNNNLKRSEEISIDSELWRK